MFILTLYPNTLITSTNNYIYKSNGVKVLKGSNKGVRVKGKGVRVRVRVLR